MSSRGASGDWAACVLAAILAGLAQALSIAAPWDGQPIWWLQLLSLLGLLWSVRRAQSWRGAAGLGWLFGGAWLSGTFWWLFISLHTYGGLPALLAVLAVLGLAFFLASYYAFACGAYFALSDPPEGEEGGRLFDPALRALLFAALWLLAELLRNSWFTGFPWGAGGYAHLDGPLAPMAKMVGVYGLGCAAALLAAILFESLRRMPRRALALCWLPVLPLVLLVLAGRHVYSEPGAVIEVSLLQGNIPQDEKFQAGTGVPLALNWYGEQLRDAKAALVIAPETAIPMLPQQLPEGYWDGLLRRYASGTQAALVGVPQGSYKVGYTNSVAGVRPGQAEPYRYDKHHLVPFGEFIPPLFRWFTQMLNIPLGDFNRGAMGQPSFAWQGQRIAPNICYEDLFGDELGARFIDAASAPTIFANVSNIGWFGNTVAIDQHLVISRMRALEFERPMVRATNTGATAIIGHDGSVQLLLPRHTRAVLTGPVEGRTGVTPFAWWVSRLGLWPLWLAAMAVPLAAWWRRRTGRPALHP